MDANRTSPDYKLTDELARYCLPPARRDASRRLAWVNSVCILFLIIGIVGAKQPVLSIKRPPPLAAQIIPTVIEPPATKTEPEKVEPTEEEKQTAAPQVVAVTLDAPNINFSVPTIGNLVVPNTVAVAPPLNPTNVPQRLVQKTDEVFSTDQGGDRPRPTYPKLAEEEGLEGSVTLTMVADENGRIISVTITESSNH